MSVGSYGRSRDSTSPDAPELLDPPALPLALPPELPEFGALPLPEGSMLPSMGLTPVACSGRMLSSWPAFWGSMR